MKRKIFVSYKYNDSTVKQVKHPFNTTARDYVDILENLLKDEYIYKGEHDGEDLSNFKDETIWTSLKKKIFDSTVTIVLVSPNMKEKYENESDQWIPQEISYSLKEITHDGRTSKTNALIYVILPDKFGRYDYYINCSYNKFQNKVLFNIMMDNLNNYKKTCLKSYAIIVNWDEFYDNYNSYINEAVKNQNDVEHYDIVKNIRESKMVF